MAHLAMARSATAEWLAAQLQIAHHASIDSRNSGSYISNACVTQGFLLVVAVVLIFVLYQLLPAGWLPVPHWLAITLFVILALAVVGGLVIYPCFVYSRKIWPDFVALVQHVRFTMFDCGLLVLVLLDTEGERLPALRQPPSLLEQLSGLFTSAAQEHHAKPPQQLRHCWLSSLRITSNAVLRRG